jgi:tryptophan-rich sensory protein
MGFLLATLAVGAVASIFTAPNIAGWYAGLVKPSFNPPNWVFAPVWTALYIAMAVAAWRVWRITGWRSGALRLYTLQLTLNFFWSVIFFKAHLIRVAMADLVALFIVVAVTGLVFWRTERTAGLLFIPYLAWTGFALALNYDLWVLNPGL